MPKVAGPWLAGAQDSDRAAAKAAQDALKQVFPTPEKLASVGKAFQQPILEYCRDAMVNETVQTLSDERTVSKDDAEATYARVIATSLAVITNLLADLPEDEVTKQREVYESTASESQIWAFASFNDVSVRRAAHRFLGISLKKQKEVLGNHLDKISAAYIGKALHSDQTGSTLDFIQALVSLTASFPTVWTSDYSGKKSAAQRLRQCMKRGSQSGPPEFWTHTWTLFSRLPNDVLPKDYAEAKELLAAIHDGLSQREERFNAAPAWYLYFKVADLIQTGDVASRLSDEEHEQLTREMVLPVVQQYLRPSQDATHWTISGTKAAWNVSKSAFCSRVAPLLVSAWPEYARSFMEDLKTSLPEQAKDFDKSQTSIAATGERWALLQMEFLREEYNMPDAVKQAFVQTTRSLVQESLQLLRSRNGKPYGAAAVVDEMLNHCNELVLGDLETHNAISDFVADVLPELLFAPSQRQLISLLYHFKNDPRFAEIWNKAASALANAPDSPEKLAAFRLLLVSPRVKPAAEMALKNADIQAYVQRQFESSISTDSDWSFIASILKAEPKVVSDGTTDSILARLTESLMISETATAALDGLAEISRSSVSRVKSFTKKADGKQLLPNLLLLEQSNDDPEAHKAADLSKRLLAGTDEASSQEALFDVIHEALDNTSVQALPIQAVLDMADKLVGDNASASKTPGETVVPNLELWNNALQLFWSTAPRPSLSITNPLGGAVYLVQLTDRSTDATIDRDADGFSQALRFAMYSARVFNRFTLFEALPTESRSELFRLLQLTVLLASDNISIAGANDLWTIYTPEVEAEMLDFITEAQQLITHCLHQPSDGVVDSAYSFVSEAISNFTKGFGSRSSADFYGARMCHTMLTELVETHGHGPNDTQRWEDLLRDARKERAFFRLSASMAALRESLRNNGQFNRYCNELVADLTGVDISGKPEKALEDLVMLNATLQNHEDVTTVVAKQRIIFLVKHILPWLQEDSVSTATKAEVCKSLSVLMPAMSDMYGEHWTQILSCVATAVGEGCISDQGPEVDEYRLPLVHAALKLYGTLRRLKAGDDPNDDLIDAWRESEASMSKAMLDLLRQDQGVADDLHQPLKITNELLAREVGKLPTTQISEPGSLYPLLYAPSHSIQRTAFDLLHKFIPSIQEQVSFDAALENQTAQLPEELLSLILETPSLDALASAHFDRSMPLDLQGYLFSWLLIFDHFTNSSYKVKTDYIENLKEGSYLSGLLDFTFDFLGHSRGKPVDASKFDVQSYSPDTEESPERDVQWLLTHLYYLALTHLPSLTKSYYLDLTSRQTSLAVESWTSKYISPLIVQASLASVQEWASTTAKDDPDYENVTVKVAMRSKEVNVSYLVDEQTMAIVVRLPDTYPLTGARVEGVSRVAVDEKKWQSWLRSCQGVITFSVSSTIPKEPFQKQHWQKR